MQNNKGGQATEWVCIGLHYVSSASSQLRRPIFTIFSKTSPHSLSLLLRLFQWQLSVCLSFIRYA